MMLVDGDNVYRDGVDLTAERFHKMLAGQEQLPTTSQPPPASFLEVFKRAAADAEQVVGVIVSSALSGTYRSAEAAAGQGPDLPIHLADSRGASLLQGLLVLKATEMAEMAVRNGVEKFLLVSTDKAINPTSVMGATKRLAEIFVQSLHAANDTPTEFMVVRFGNVLGSSGSVIPIFEKQIDEGGPVTVTHPEVTRYFMTIHEAVGLILQAASQAKGGEIFVLDMGNPIKIIDLANQLIELHGHRPGEDIEIVFNGLKPGEKLFEEISHMGENLEKTNHSKILRFVSEPVSLAEVRKQLQDIEENLYHLEPDQIKLLFKKVIPEYQPYLS